MQKGEAGMNLKSQNATSKNDNALRSQFATFDSSKKWFAFSKMGVGAVGMLAKLEGKG